MAICIQDITADNWLQACKLKVKKEQECFVAPNAVSIAQSKYESFLDCHGIYVGEILVGFAATGRNPEDNEIWIARHMIGKQFQGKGYGSAGLAALIDYLKERHNCSKIFLTVEPENHIAIQMYEKAGFTNTGQKMVNSLIYVLEL